MRAPMMLIHTVAAGGGSILHFDGARFRVGPGLGRRRSRARAATAAAGRSPSPTPTSCWASSSPAFFPRDLRARPATSRSTSRACATAFAELARRGRRRARAPEEVADGFIRIAVANMAEAIKKISVARGYDVTRYALNAFGGAGGQHACLVADALAMTDRADPSLLGAALGLWHGPRRHPRHAPAGRRGAVRGRARHLRARRPPRSVCARGRRRRSASRRGRRPGRAHVRYAGIATARAAAHHPLCRHRYALEVRRRDLRRPTRCLGWRCATRCSRMRDFEAAHRAASASSTRARSSSSRPSRSRLSAAARSRTSTLHAAVTPAELPRPTAAPASIRRARWHDAAVYRARQLMPGPCASRGPALVIEPHQTIVVEHGWQAAAHRARTTSC